MPNFKKITPPNFVRKNFSVVFTREYLKKQDTKILTVDIPKCQISKKNATTAWHLGVLCRYAKVFFDNIKQDLENSIQVGGYLAVKRPML